MGEYAALAASREMGVTWDEAFEMLYGDPEKEAASHFIPTERRCPICATSKKNRALVISHIDSFHRRTGQFRQQHHAEKFASWLSQTEQSQ